MGKIVRVSGDGSWVLAGRFSEDCCAILKNRPRKNPENRPDASLAWLTPRPPEEGAVAWNPDGTATLLSSPAPLASVDARNILLRRQDRFDFTSEARLALPHLMPGQEAGIIGYYDENSWVLASVYAREDGTYGFRTTEHIGHDSIVHEDAAARIPAEEGTFTFTMETQGLARTFRIKKEDAGTSRILHEVCLSNVFYLSDEGVKMGKRFTGAMMGVAGAGGDTQFRYTLKSFT